MKTRLGLPLGPFIEFLRVSFFFFNLENGRVGLVNLNCVFLILSRPTKYVLFAVSHSFSRD